MLTGELRNQIDRLWDAFWSGGISNSPEAMDILAELWKLEDEIQAGMKELKAML